MRNLRHKVEMKIEGTRTKEGWVTRYPLGTDPESETAFFPLQSVIERFDTVQLHCPEGATFEVKLVVQFSHAPK